MLSPTSAFLRCACIAITAVSLSYLPLKAQAQETLSANMTSGVHAWYNPPDATPPYTAFTPGSINMGVDYTLLASADTNDPTVTLTSFDLYAYECDYYTNFQMVPMNNNNAKYTVTASGFSTSHAWTVVNQAYGTYYWRAKPHNNGNEFAWSNMYGGYGNGG